MAYEPGHRDACRDDVAGATRASGLVAVASLASNDFSTGPCPSCHRVSDAGRSLLGDDCGSLVVADIASGRGNLPQRPHSKPQTDYLAALLAPLSGDHARTHSVSLLDRFGSIAGVAAARRRELAEVFGSSSTLPVQIAAVRRLLQAGLREHVTRGPLDSAAPGLLQFVVAHFCGLQHEEMLALFGDAGGRFIDHETVAAGPSHRMEFSPARLFRRAVALGAVEIVLAHNHPSGVAHPSADDLTSTRRVVRDAKLLGIMLRDHLIVGGNAVFSMSRAGLL